jgi:hypothetical protein
MRKTLSGKPESREFGKTLELLTLHDPGPVAEYLVRWTDPKDDSRMQCLGYVLGSYFAWRCGKDRERHLKKLLGAKDEYIRAAGAVYLCFTRREPEFAHHLQLQGRRQLPHRGHLVPAGRPRSLCPDHFRVLKQKVKLAGKAISQALSGLRLSYLLRNGGRLNPCYFTRIGLGL